MGASECAVLARKRARVAPETKKTPTPPHTRRCRERGRENPGWEESMVHARTHTRTHTHTHIYTQEEGPKGGRRDAQGSDAQGGGDRFKKLR